MLLTDSKNAQRNFLDTWVSYEVLRRNLDFDLGTMQVDARGNRIDPGTIDGTIAERAAAALGITLDGQACCPLQLLQAQRLDNNANTDLDGQAMPTEPMNADVSGDDAAKQRLLPPARFTDAKSRSAAAI